MPLTANEKNLPRLHLLGTGLVLLVVTLSLAAFFSWQSLREQSAAFERIEQVISAQQQTRLTAEMTSAMGYLAFTRSRTEALLRQSAAS